MRRRISHAGIAFVAFGICAAASACVRPDPQLTPSTPSPATAAADIFSLDSGVPFERQLAPGEEHRYELTLKPGEYVRVVIEQLGIDVVAQTRRTDDTVYADFQDEITIRGQERVEIVADNADPRTLIIKPADGEIHSGAYTVHLDDRHVATDADRSMQEGRRLRTAAARLYELDDAEGARALLERALTLTERARGPEDPQVANVAAQLATVAQDVPDMARAEALYQRAIAIIDNAYGAQHPLAAIVRAQLAKLYQATSQRPKGEALIRPALEIIERELGPEHLWFVRSLGVQAALRNDAGDFQQTEANLRRELAILEKIGYTNSLLYAGALNNLGEIYGRRRDFVSAEDLLQRALAIGEKVRGPDCLFISNPLNNLGIVARQQRDYVKAEAYLRRALSIRERVAGVDHPDLTLPLINLGNIYSANGDYAKALETQFHALKIGEAAFGPYHGNTLLSMGNIARVYAASGDLSNAITYQRRADAIIEMQLELNLTVGSERQKLALVNNITERSERTISLSLREASRDPAAASLAALVLLQRKGRVLDTMSDTFAAVRQRLPGSEDRALLDQFNATTKQLASLALDPRPEGLPGERVKAIRDVEARRERLETELSEHSGEWRARTQAVTLETVQAAIPDGAVLIEFAVFRPFDPRAERNVDAYGPPHYVAYIVPRRGPPIGQDLGAAAAIDRAIDAFRQALRDPQRADLKQIARAVDERVMRPLRTSIAPARRLLISPDGDLNLVPFEALVDEHGRYLIERYAMSYLTSGRDLLRLQVPRSPRSAAVIVADPVFGEPPQPATRSALDTRGAMDRSGSSALATGERLSAIYFAPLGATADEGRAIKALFPPATLLTGLRATKSELQQVEAPRMLHIASHGFFLPDPTASPNGNAPGTSPAPVDNPLLRSGLALAGANLTRERENEGILTALEASGLDLWGTKLVTLSACDTGVGEVRNGEGVYGLRRAFVLAGAETLVMSLWPVSDYVSRQTMVAYYTGLRAGLGRGDALRRAKLAILQRPNRQHPFYWASFIQSGEWASLDGKR